MKLAVLLLFVAIGGIGGALIALLILGILGAEVWGDAGWLLVVAFAAGSAATIAAVLTTNDPDPDDREADGYPCRRC